MHAVSVVSYQGAELERFTVEHTAAGLRRLPGRLQRAGVTEVGIERPDGPVVDALLAAGLTVLVISPNRVRGLRSRYGSAGNKDVFLRREAALRSDHAAPPAAERAPRVTVPRCPWRIGDRPCRQDMPIELGGLGTLATSREHDRDSGPSYGSRTGRHD
jgi:hypothetical protein